MLQYEEIEAAFADLQKKMEAYVANMLDADLRDAYVQAAQRHRDFVRAYVAELEAN